MAQAQASQVDQSAKENHRLRGAITGSQTAIMMVDRDFNITYVNPATEKLIAKNIKDKKLTVLDNGQVFDRALQNVIQGIRHQRQTA